MSTSVPWHRLALRRLLQLDKPLPERSAEEVEAERARNYPWNFKVNLLDGATFWLGLSFASSTTILPLFVTKLTDSPWPVGLIAVVNQGGWFLPQLFTARAVEQAPRKKPLVVNLGFFTERLPMWFLPLAALLAARSPTLSLVVLLLAYTWHTVGAGAIGTAWQDLIARCFPVQTRGRFLGLTTFIGTGLGALGGILSGWILANFAFPQNFAYTFLLAAIGVTVSWVFIALTREPTPPQRPPRRDNREFRADLGRILRSDHNFRRFLVARVTLALAAMGQGFVTVAAVRRWNVPDGTVGGYTSALLIGQTAGNLLFGLLADRHGHKLSLELSALSLLLAFLLAWLAPVPIVFFAVFVLLGLALGGVVVSGILVVLEFSAPERRPTYAGLANTIVGVAGSLAPLLGAGLAAISYDLLFAVSAGFALVSFALMHWWVREPRWAA